MTFKSSIAPKGDIGLKELKDEDSLVVVKDGVISSGTIDENAGRRVQGARSSTSWRGTTAPMPPASSSTRRRRWRSARS